ncbi:MAG: valine--tRNA ligase [Candidatus Omnitrophota bacterium]
MEEFATKYNFKEVEARRYEFWEKNHYFHGQVNKGKSPFSIVIPPPNVTGILHMGHALNNTIQDVLIRYKKMSGFESLWMPGTDHAGIATQNVVEKKIAKEGLRRQDLGREKFLEYVWSWKQEYGSTIIKQLKHLGCACDWDRIRFTMDAAYSDAVLEVFVRLYEKDLIYRGFYIINWCPRCQTALSDEEAPHKDTQGFLYHIKYPIVNSKDNIVVATTRPETMLGDTAVAVNPQDKRYKHLIGKTVILPLMEREIKIIADDFVDPEFGTGAVKVTPAHDPNDYALGKRHKLEFINIFNPDGVCNENAGNYAGKDRFAARATIIEDLKQRKLLIKTQSHAYAVGHCYRCHTVVEPYYSKQWFVRMKPLSIAAIKAVKESRIKFYPKRWTKVYLNWMENIQDWCISRQIWWGHRLPVYYCQDCQIVQNRQKDEKSDCIEKNGVIIAKFKPEKCPDCNGKNITQDPDVLDTWFSSWLWPFATFGWPFTGNRQQATGSRQNGLKPETCNLQREELSYFYPTSVLVTAPEIIFFWVARMIMAGFEFMGDIPFKDVYIHGTVRDDLGKKMSKSLGNSIDPLEIINEYGTDALRFSLISITAMGQDIFLSKDKFEFGRNFANKIWNASRFILMNLNHEELTSTTNISWDKEKLGLANAWILSRLNSTIKNVKKSFSLYRLNEAANILYEFFWHQFCDWYIEFSKSDIKDKITQCVLFDVLKKSLCLLHPFMPLITDDLWQKVTQKTESIYAQAQPDIQAQFIDQELERQMERLITDITVIRNLRSQTNIKPKDEVSVQIFETDKENIAFIKKHSIYLKRLAKLNHFEFINKNSPPDMCAASGVALSSIIYLIGAEVDRAVEKEKLEKQIQEIIKHIANRDKQLGNPVFRQKAPKKIIENLKQSRDELKIELEKLKSIKNGLREKKEEK